jgi:hypothetical protein
LLPTELKKRKKKTENKKHQRKGRTRNLKEEKKGEFTSGRVRWKEKSIGLSFRSAYRMSSIHADSPQPSGASISSINANQQLSFNPRNDGKWNNASEKSRATRDNGRDDVKHDESSDSSELEEGEISERDLPPGPPVNKRTPVLSVSSQHYKKRKPPSSRTQPFRESPNYPYNPEYEQLFLQGGYGNSPTPPQFPTMYSHTPTR